MDSKLNWQRRESMGDDTRKRSSDVARDASTPPNGSDGNQNMNRPDGHLDAEMVSAWLDAPDDFSEQDRLAIETHLASCSQCRQVAAELTAIVRAFQTLPLAEIPHSFALADDVAGMRTTPTLPAARQLEEPANLHERKRERETRKPVQIYEREPWYERQMRTLRWMTTVAALLFVFLISADVLGNIDTGTDNDDDSAPIAMDAPASGAAESAATATTSGASVMVAPEDEADDSERSANAEATPASANDETTGGGEAATGPAEGEEEASTPQDAETMLTTETPVPDQFELAQRDDTSVAGYGSANDITSGQSAESNTLYLIELALAIIIAWLIVAMIALPKWRRG
jgi:hypothetical protein